MPGGLMFVLEILHSLDENLNAFHREGVVERCAEAADAAVTLDANDAAFAAEIHEFFFKFLVFGFHHEAYVHD